MWSGLYHQDNKTGITLAMIKRFREAFRVGDMVMVPIMNGDTSYRPDYQPICTVIEIHDFYVTVDHGKWKESIQYIDIMTQVSGCRIIMADYAAVNEYYSKLSMYWQMRDLVFSGREDLVGRLESLEERLEELEPLVKCHERFIGLHGSENVASDSDEDWRKCYEIPRSL